MIQQQFMNFNEKAKEVIDKATKISKRLKMSYTGTQHILLAMLSVKDSIAFSVLQKAGVTYKDVLTVVKSKYAQNKVDDFVVDFSARATKIIDESQFIARALNKEKVSTEHILIALLTEKDGIADEVISSLHINRNDIIKELEKSIGSFIDLSAFDFDKVQKPVMSILDRFCKDYTMMAYERKFDPVIGRKQELKRIAQILTRKTKNNPLLVGEAGVGKTAIVEAFAMNIVAGIVPTQLQNKRLLALDLTSMVAGTKFRGEFEERIKLVIEEIVNSGDIILFIDEIHTLIGAGAGEGSLDASNILKPYLARGDIKLIGATTTSEYKKYLSKDKALARRLQKIVVEETTEEETIEILKGLKDVYEKHHNVVIEDDALEAAVHLSKRYIADSFLPDKAIDTIDEACSNTVINLSTPTENILAIKKQIDEIIKEQRELLKAPTLEKLNELKKEQIKLEKKYENAHNRWKKAASRSKIVITKRDIEEIVSVKTKIPISKLSEKDSIKLSKLDVELKKRVIGQDEAVAVLSKAIKRGRIGLSDPKKPIGSFLFLGPTGVGKTELCKALAVALFGEEKALIRVDMSEYMEKHSVSKMIGAPPGYVGFEDGGGLSEQVRRRPYSVVLFDEIEKAHPEVFNILLQILDDGHITDGSGRVTDFKNTVVIMTGNIGARTISNSKKLGFTADNKKIDYDTMKKNVFDATKKLFRPEFLNRIDEIVVFRSLNMDNIIGIVDILFKEFKDRVKKQLDIDINITFAAKKHLAQKGFDEIYGARPVKRAIVSLVQDELTDKILAGEFVAGDKVAIGLKKGELTFCKKSE